MAVKRAAVTFVPGGRVSVEPGATLVEAARLAGVPLDAPCGGTGTCGKCGIFARGELSVPTEDEVAALGVLAIASGMRLACRARVLGEATVELETSVGPRVVEGAYIEPSWTPDGATGARFGAALDIGTTTIVVALAETTTGAVVARCSALSAQQAWGADVISRIAAIQREGEARVRSAVIEQISALLGDAVREAGAAEREIGKIAVCGNTAMRGIFLGEDVVPLGVAPYEGVPLGSRCVTAEELGLSGLGRATVDALPCASAFIGADVVAGLVATRFAERPAPSLYLDLGTNAEIVLSTGAGLLAASAAAGPALEGAGIRSGIRAIPGAVERVRLEEGGLAISTIGDVPPLGLCGSGALDLVAALLDAGVLDLSGRMQEVEGPLGPCVVEMEDQLAFALDEARRVVLTQNDVRTIQLAKGAVRAAVELLLAEAGVAVHEMTEVVVAGGFGLRVDPRTLVRIGIFPEPWVDRVRFVGNAALEGARACVVSGAARAEAERVAGDIVTLDLAADKRFQAAFLASLGFPSES